MWKNRDYHVQNNEDVEHQDVKMYCTTNQFPELKFSFTHKKSHGSRRLVNRCNMRFYPKLGHGT